MKYLVIKTGQTALLLFLFITAGKNVFSQRIAPAAYSSSAPVSYVRTWDVVKPETNPNNISTSNTLQQSRMVTQYFDGLGRPVQTVMKQGSLISGGIGVDMVSPFVYDSFGREQFKYLPFAANSTGGNTHINDGLLKLNPFQEDSVFSAAQYPGESWYYSQTVFEASPLNRTLQSFAPGNNWVGTVANNESSATSLKIKYFLNTVADSVRMWNVTDVANAFGTYATSTMYPKGVLYKNIAICENGKQLIEFKDKDGKTILKKVQLAAVADDGTGKGHYGWLCTYYIYDDTGNLRCVIQPRGVELLIIGNWSLTTTLLDEQCFRYEYDARNRVVRKKVPGAVESWMVYDARDRLVMMQDANLRNQQKWMYMVYDNLNRDVSAGLITDAVNYNNLSYHLQNAFSSTTYPNLANYPGYEELSKIFYDDYNWRSNEGNPLSASRNISYDSYLQTASDVTWPYPQALTQTGQLTGIPTGTKIKVLGTNTYLYTVTFYDEKARPVQVQSTNVTGGTDITTTQYTWSSQAVLAILENEKAGANAQTSIALTQLSYDDLGRVIKTEKKVSNTNVNSGAMPGSWQTVSQNQYNTLGQLRKKSLGTAPLDSLVYDYNIRGWLLGANRNYVKDTLSTTNWFGFDLGYDKTAFTINGVARTYTAAQLNGNIAGMMWKSSGDDELRKYDFSYDATNRLIGADFNQLTAGVFNKNALVDFSVSGLTYDANGNILSMNEKGWKLGGSVTIDSLLYNYITNSNKLLNVIDRRNDTATKLGDFRSSKAYMTALGNNKTTAATDYSYDANGNLTLDNNKDISYVHYNHLNLPDSIVVTGKGSIKYVYDAAGSKLKKITTEGTKITTTLYLFGNFRNDSLQFLPQEEGRLRFDSSKKALYYDYFVRDHLGNVRMILSEQKDTSFYPPASLETAQLTNERLIYSKVDTGRVNKSIVSGYPSDTYTNPNDYIQKTGTNGVKVGTGVVLKVMAGDQFNLRVSSWWSNAASPNSPVSPLNDLVAALAGSVGALPGKPSATELINSGVLSPSATGFLNSESGYVTSKPKAFINWILFDERFNYVANSSGFEQVGSSGVFTTHTRNNLVLAKSGYLYVYVSNETPNIDVFFDNLQVTHIRGPLLEESHYYPFGLTMAGISSQALRNNYVENKYKFNAATELSNKEFSDGSGLDIYETAFRGLDPQLGRFCQIDPLSSVAYRWSPYTFSWNNPVLFADPDGLLSTESNPVVGEEAIVVASHKAKKKEKIEPTLLPKLTSPLFRVEALPYNPKNVVRSDNQSLAGQNLAIGIMRTNPEAVAFVLAAGTTVLVVYETAVAQNRDGGTTILPPGWASRDNIDISLPRTVYLPRVNDDDLAPPFPFPINPPKFKDPKIEYLYRLKAARSGYYPIYQRGFAFPVGRIYLNEGDTWKYGTSIDPDHRYTMSTLLSTGQGLLMDILDVGGATRILSLQKGLIMTYTALNGQRPPGNKVNN